MARNVYAWPPVGVTGWEWSEVAPMAVSRSIISGADYASASGPRRKIAALNVSALGRGRSGAGYIENLKTLLDGGVNLVRLNSTPVNWWLDAARLQALRQSQPLGWKTGDNPLAWQSGANPLKWFGGAVLTGAATTVGGVPALSVSGLPVSRLVARPAEYVTLFSGGLSDVVGVTARVLTEAWSDASGVAVIKLMSALTGTGRANIGTSESAVFKADSMPRAMQGLNGDWSYAWSFRQVFSDEVGGFTEVNPWT